MTDIRADLLEILGNTTILPERFDRLVAYVEGQEALAALGVAHSRIEFDPLPEDLEAAQWFHINGVEYRGEAARAKLRDLADGGAPE